jgi:hypothetical protein
LKSIRSVVANKYYPINIHSLHVDDDDDDDYDNNNNNNNNNNNKSILRDF